MSKLDKFGLFLMVVTIVMICIHLFVGCGGNSLQKTCKEFSRLNADINSIYIKEIEESKSDPNEQSDLSIEREKKIILLEQVKDTLDSLEVIICGLSGVGK